MDPTRYRPSRHYVTAGFVSLALAGFSAWSGATWSPAFVPAALFFITAALLFFLGSRPPIEVSPERLLIGRQAVPWAQIRRVDTTGYTSPLIVHITLATGRRILVIFPGDLDSSHSLLRQMRRGAREALIDGIPYRQFWNDVLPPAANAATPPARQQAPRPRYRVLRPEDEAEVERLYQLLKTVGHLDQKNTEEK
jgi:hypothetical protein